MSKTKKIVLAISLVVILVCGIWASVVMGNSEPTYDGTHMDLVDLYENNSNYDNSTADGAASIMCFDGDDLAYMIGAFEGEEMVMKIIEVSDSVDDSLFEIPADYTVMEM